MSLIYIRPLIDQQSDSVSIAEAMWSPERRQLSFKPIEQFGEVLIDRAQRPATAAHSALARAHRSRRAQGGHDGRRSAAACC